MNITVYLASSTGNDSKFEEAVKELGSWIGVSGNTLVYGGSKTGLMGELAQSVLQAGGKVIGGIGISGGTAKEDTVYAETAVKIFNEIIRL